MESVETLVDRCRAGDTAAFRALFAKHKSEVSRLVYRMTGPSAELEDLVQEVFLQVFRSLKDFMGGARFSTWLYRVTVNVVLMHRRASRARPRYTALPGGDFTDGRVGPDEEVEGQRRLRALYRLLDRLSEKKRTVFILHELEGLSPKEIANLVQAPVLTVRTRLFYARRELASMLPSEPCLADLLLNLEQPSGGVQS
jgi:RNA polymerase sigma-70 factor (ECF subfamily)